VSYLGRWAEAEVVEPRFAFVCLCFNVFRYRKVLYHLLFFVSVCLLIA
jgi:hypothetical protein